MAGRKSYVVSNNGADDDDNGSEEDRSASSSSVGSHPGDKVRAFDEEDADPERDQGSVIHAQSGAGARGEKKQREVHPDSNTKSDRVLKRKSRNFSRVDFRVEDAVQLEEGKGMLRYFWLLREMQNLIHTSRLAGKRQKLPLEPLAGMVPLLRFPLSVLVGVCLCFGGEGLSPQRGIKRNMFHIHFSFVTGALVFGRRLCLR